MSIRQEKNLCFEPRVLDQVQEAAMKDKSEYRYKKNCLLYIRPRSVCKSDDLIKNYLSSFNNSNFLFRFPKLSGTGIYITSDNNPENKPTKYRKQIFF